MWVTRWRSVRAATLVLLSPGGMARAGPSAPCVFEKPPDSSQEHIFHYPLWLPLDPGIPGCIQNYLPLKEDKGIMPGAYLFLVCVCARVCLAFVHTHICAYRLFGTISNESRRRKWQPTPVFLPGESQGQRRLVGCLKRLSSSRSQ